MEHKINLFMAKTTRLQRHSYLDKQYLRWHNVVYLCIVGNDEACRFQLEWIHLLWETYAYRHPCDNYSKVRHWPKYRIEQCDEYRRFDNYRGKIVIVW